MTASRRYKPGGYRVRIALVREREDLPAYRIEMPCEVDTFIRKATNVQNDATEMIGVIFMDGRHNIIGFEEVARGGLNVCMVRPPEVFRGAIVAGAKGVVLFHNHPSGDPQPSEDDYRITKRLKDVGEVVGVEVLDHLIIGSDSYVSMREEGEMP